MNYQEYQKIVRKNSSKNNKLKNSVIAFFIGGFICLLGELITTIIQKTFYLSNRDSVIWMMIIIVFFTILFTCLGFFDKWVSKTKAGLIIPITGFAHSIASCILDYRRDGFITGMGSNVFKLAGSVLLYGTVVSFVLALIKAVLYG